MYHALGDIEKSIECYQKVQDVLRKKLSKYTMLNPLFCNIGQVKM